MPPNSDCMTVNHSATGCCSQALKPAFFSLKGLEKLRKTVWESCAGTSICWGLRGMSGTCPHQMSALLILLY